LKLKRQKLAILISIANFVDSTGKMRPKATRPFHFLFFLAFQVYKKDSILTQTILNSAVQTILSENHALEGEKSIFWSRFVENIEFSRFYTSFIDFARFKKR